MAEEWLRLIQQEPQAAAVVLSAVATTVTVLLAFVGFLVNHVSSIRRQQLEARLAFTSAQLERLYGPLYALTQSNTASYNVFRKTFRPDLPIFDRANPFSDEERKIWKTWAENVFIPSNLKIRDVIEQNAHLVAHGEMPPEFESMLAHVEASKLVLPALAEGDTSVLDNFPPWPSNFNAFVFESYERVVRDHARLLGRAHRSIMKHARGVRAAAVS